MLRVFLQEYHKMFSHQCIGVGNDGITFSKVKAHATWADIEAGLSNVTHKTGNDSADTADGRDQST